MTSSALLTFRPNGLKVLAWLLGTIFIVGLSLAFATLAKTSFDKNFFSQDLCFSNTCVRDYISHIDQSLAIIKSTLDVGVAIATIGGIFVALLSYFNSAGNAALTNHIEHLKIFVEYIESEITKRDRLSSEHIDTLLLYNTIFSQSRSGKTSVSPEYVQFIMDLNLIIEESNQRCVVGTPGGFSYKDHQRKIRDHLAPAGITVYTAPRNDYFEMESQLFSLLHRIGQSFCPPSTPLTLVGRQYY